MGTVGIFDPGMVSILLGGLLGILKCGESAPPPNPYALMIAESPDLGMCYHDDNTFIMVLFLLFS